MRFTNCVSERLSWIQIGSLIPVTVKSGKVLGMGVFVGDRVGVNVDIGVFVGMIVEVNVGLGVSVVTTEVSRSVCVGEIETGSCIAVVDGLKTTSKNVSTTRIVAMRRIMAKMTCDGNLGLRLFVMTCVDFTLHRVQHYGTGVREKPAIISFVVNEFCVNTGD